MDPYGYCQERAAASGSSFYYSFLFLPPEKRRAITALYAFCREVDDAVDECRDPALARLKLGWWREELERTFSGTPLHPVGRALQEVIRGYALSRAHFLEIIEGMEMDLEQPCYPDFEALSLYCHRAAGVVGWLSAEILGYRNPNTLRYAHDLGMALQLTNILRDVREDARRGRRYLPLEECRRFGVRPEDFHAHTTSPALQALLAFQGQRIASLFHQAFAALPDEDRPRQRASIIMASLYQALLKAIRRNGYRVLEQRIHLSPLRKLWLAWHTACKAQHWTPSL